MNTAITNYVSQLSRRDFTSNTQRVLHTLLMTNSPDGWVSRSAIRVPSAAARLRDLRKPAYGALEIECASASDLCRRGTKNTFFYRINPRGLTLSQVRMVFEGI